jgi:hypothetical protein
MNSQTNTGHTVTSLTMQTVPARIHTFLYDKIKQCVDMENQTRPDGTREMNIADFIRIAAAEKVGRVLKEPVSEIPPVIRGRGGSLPAQAAKKSGLSSGEFQATAVEILSMITLGYNADDLIAKLISGETQVVGGNQPQHAKPKSGQHQVQARQVGPGVRSVRRQA